MYDVYQVWSTGEKTLSATFCECVDAAKFIDLILSPEKDDLVTAIVIEEQN